MNTSLTEVLLEKKDKVKLEHNLASFCKVVGPRAKEFTKTKDTYSKFFDSGLDAELTQWVLISLSKWDFLGGIKEIKKSGIWVIIKALCIDDGTCFGPKAFLGARELFERMKTHKDPAQWKGELKLYSENYNNPRIEADPADLDLDIFEREHQYMARLTRYFAFTNDERARFNIVMKNITRKVPINVEHPTSYRNPSIWKNGPFDIRDATEFGHNGVPLGTWWPYRICAIRDGAHSAIESGIVGNESTGAYSIVVSSSDSVDSSGRQHRYAADDHGNVLWYQSTFGDITRNGAYKFSFGAGALKKSKTTRLPVRVIRGKGCTSWAPCVGYRYDGLYTVTRLVFVRNEKGKPGYKCMLTRNKNQEKLADIWARSPTMIEIAIAQKMQLQLKASLKAAKAAKAIAENTQLPLQNSDIDNEEYMSD